MEEIGLLRAMMGRRTYLVFGFVMPGDGTEAASWGSSAAPERLPARG